jgi:putative ABC transport system permease protein
MNIVWQNVRYTLRTIGKNPAVGLVVILTLALGIGANIAIFSLIHAVLLRPLPYREPDRIVQIWGRMPTRNIPFHFVPYPDFAEWKAQSRAFESMSAYRQVSMSLTGQGEPRRVSCLLVNADFFPTAGVPLAHGRGFLPEEDKPGAQRVAVVNHALWQNAFGSDPGVLGRAVTLDGIPHVVVGVLPDQFEMAVPEVDFYVPIAASNARTPQAMGLSVGSCARLRPGVTLQSAQSEIDTINARLNAQYGGNPRNARVWGLREFMVRNVRVSLWILMGAVALVLLIACANVANILLARAGVRRQEMALRAALGASRGRIVRQILSECLVLSLAGGGFGVLLASWGVAALVKSASESYPLIQSAAITAPVLAFSLAASVLAGMLIGAVPAFSLARESSSLVVQACLKEGSHAVTSGKPSGRKRSALVICETALSVMLLIAAGLLLRSLIRLQQVDPGFSSEGVITAAISLPPGSYPNSQKRAMFYENLLQNLRLAPEIECAGIVEPLPLSGTNIGMGFFPEGRPTPAPGDVPIVWSRYISEDYFRTMSTPLLGGRWLNGSDNQNSPPAAIVSRTLANRFWPGQNAIGMRFGLGGPLTTPNATPITVVGVSGDIRHMNLAQDPEAEVFISYRQMAPARITLVARSRLDPARLGPILQKALASVDKDLPLAKLRTMDQMVSDSLATRRLTALLLFLFAVTAVLLAAVGVFGIIAYAVTQRRHEIGIRRALGAESSDVLRTVAGQPLLLAGIGEVAGLAASYAFRHTIESELYLPSGMDPMIFTGVPLLLMAVATSAALLASRRALHIDPILALRRE